MGLPGRGSTRINRGKKGCEKSLRGANQNAGASDSLFLSFSLPFSFPVVWLLEGERRIGAAWVFGRYLSRIVFGESPGR